MDHFIKTENKYKKNYQSINYKISSPIIIFEQWFSQAKEQNIDEYNAMCIATVDQFEKPHARMVLLKHYDPLNHSFYFFTNTLSAKVIQIQHNAAGCLTFYWSIFQRQIRIEGKIKAVKKEIAETYFASRSKESQISALISQQSSVVENRETLEKLWHETNLAFKGKKIPFPKHWGGFKLQANYYEFWQGRQHRLHERLCFEKKNEAWEKMILAP